MCEHGKFTNTTQDIKKCAHTNISAKRQKQNLLGNVSYPQPEGLQKKERLQLASMPRRLPSSQNSPCAKSQDPRKPETSGQQYYLIKPSLCYLDIRTCVLAVRTIEPFLTWLTHCPMPNPTKPS